MCSNEFTLVVQRIVKFVRETGGKGQIKIIQNAEVDFITYFGTSCCTSFCMKQITMLRIVCKPNLAIFS